MGKKKGGGVRIKQVGPKMPPAAGMMNPMDALQIPPEEMVHLPPPVDRKYQIFWPIHESFTMDPSQFQVIYPSYLDKTKTVKLGRRIAASKSVDTPTVSDLSQALMQLQVRHVIQPYKGYSRDIECQWDNPGRVLVDVSNFKKKQLLLELAARIPDLPDRLSRLERQAQEKLQAEAERKAAAAAAANQAPKKIASSSGGGGGVGSSKKKGKKGKRK